MTGGRAGAHRWSEHKTEKGVTYYYNSITKVSTYDKPEGFGADTPAKYAGRQREKWGARSGSRRRRRR